MADTHDSEALKGVSSFSETEVRSSSTKEMAPQEKPTKRQKIKAHFRRWWWLHVILFIVITLLIVLLLTFVGVPRIAQDHIDSSTLELESMEVSDPSPSSFHLKQTATLGHITTYHPNLDAYNASLRLDVPGAKPFAYIPIPALRSVRNGTPVIVDADTEIADLDAFTDFNKALLASETLKIRIQGRTGLHEGKFPTAHVNYNHTVTMKGLNRLQGFNVTSFQIMLSPEPDGTNMVGQAFIPNPSVATIHLGNVTLRNFVGDTLIGASRIQDMTLVPGNNTVSMRSIIDQEIVISELADFPDGMLPVRVVGNESVYDGQRLSYFEEALSSGPLSVTLNIGAALGGLS